MLLSHSILAAIAALNALVAYQDFRYRLISAWTVPALIGLFVSFLWIADDLSFLREHLILNLAYLAIIVLGICLYSFFKFKSLSNPFDKLIGWGDILLILAFAFVFETKSFIIFITLSSILSLIIAIGLKLKRPQQTIQFPYAGMMCLVFLVLGILFFFNDEISFMAFFQSSIF